jgi:SNF2 family DNA or RNA helicase
MANLLIDYDHETYQAVFRTDASSVQDAWYQQLRRALDDRTSGVLESTVGELRTPWWSFVAIREGIGSLLRSSKVNYSVTEAASSLLQRAKERRTSFRAAGTSEQPSSPQLLERLEAAGWQLQIRPLTPEQLRNVRHLSVLPAGANFSVPGAGKTTEALAYYVLRSVGPQRLLVVAPKNAFGAWEEQLAYCLGTSAGSFVRLRGGAESIAEILGKKPRLMLITYQQLSRVTELIARFFGENDVFLFLDESHKIKSGRGKATADAVLRISHLPVGKLVLSGTPMPQSVDDLIPQLEFLYPEIDVTSADVVSLIQSIFVRTTKDELKLPPVHRRIISVPFNVAQKRLYDLMRSEVIRQAEQMLTHQSRSQLRALGRSVMRLLEVVSNPSLLARDIAFLHDDLLGEVLAEGAAPKISFACERARRLAKKGLKSIIWTTFRQNVESIADQLSDLNAVYIHGGIDAGQEDDDGTREGRIRQFRYDPHCFVMVANPAAASEGISLHKVCRHAIYVDRTYNAAHYLQSEDRIHRLGLLPHESPTVEILSCPGSIDENVQGRLEAKVAAMANALNDRSLSIGAKQYIPFDLDDDPENRVDEIDVEDVRSILEWLRSER